MPIGNFTTESSTSSWGYILKRFTKDNPLPSFGRSFWTRFFRPFSSLFSRTNLSRSSPFQTVGGATGTRHPPNLVHACSLVSDLCTHISHASRSASCSCMSCSCSLGVCGFVRVPAFFFTTWFLAMFLACFFSNTLYTCYSYCSWASGVHGGVEIAVVVIPVVVVVVSITILTILTGNTAPAHTHQQQQQQQHHQQQQ